MTRRTYLDRRWPEPPIFHDVAKRWCAEQSRLLLALVWRAYDRLRDEDLSKVPFAGDDESKEESLNFLMAGRVTQCMTGDEPFWFCSQPPEMAHRKRGKGKSPTPDHGFVLYDNPRSIWPVEGKVLTHDRDLRAYLAEINGNFLTGRYAAYSREGAMLGYLLSGDPMVAMEQIGERLNVVLTIHAHFPDRHHRVSVHVRRYNKSGSADEFRCHHLILLIATP